MGRLTDYLLHSIEKGYIIDGAGNVWYRGGVVGGYINNEGYKVFSIRCNSETVKVYVHRLHAYQKFGSDIFKDGVKARHINGDPLDNTWDNIGIGTHSDNMMDIPESVRIAKAKHAASHITKKILAGGIVFESYSAAAKHFSISDNGIRKRIKLGWEGYCVL